MVNKNIPLLSFYAIFVCLEPLTYNFVGQTFLPSVIKSYKVILRTAKLNETIICYKYKSVIKLTTKPIITHIEFCLVIKILPNDIY